VEHVISMYRCKSASFLNHQADQTLAGLLVTSRKFINVITPVPHYKCVHCYYKSYSS